MPKFYQEVLDACRKSAWIYRCTGCLKLIEGPIIKKVLRDGLPIEVAICPLCGRLAKQLPTADLEVVKV